MVFVKVVKNKAYFKRFQTKFARRRAGKTDYRQRRALVVQDKNKYATPKHRLVIRLTNRAVIAQVMYTETTGDRTICSANSAELPRYGLTVGLKNYSAAYCTGLLVARRLLQKLKLDTVYTGNEEVDGTVKSCSVDGRSFWVADVDPENPRPMRALLDVGLRATTTGARVFAALKGASDGGLDIPHNEKRFVGYSREEKSFDAAAMRARIFGDHVCDYMSELKEEDPAKYNKLFSAFIAAGVEGDDLEDLYAKVHAAIRADPSPKEKLAFKPGPQDTKTKTAKRNLKQRKNRVMQKKAWRVWKLTSAAAAAESDSE